MRGEEGFFGENSRRLGTTHPDAKNLNLWGVGWWASWQKAYESPAELWDDQKIFSSVVSAGVGSFALFYGSAQTLALAQMSSVSREIIRECGWYKANHRHCGTGTTCGSLAWASSPGS